jgi:hypothetical protein
MMKTTHLGNFSYAPSLQGNRFMPAELLSIVKGYGLDE